MTKDDEGGDAVPVPDDEGAVDDDEVATQGQEGHGGSGTERVQINEEVEMVQIPVDEEGDAVQVKVDEGADVTKDDTSGNEIRVRVDEVADVAKDDGGGDSVRVQVHEEAELGNIEKSLQKCS